MHAAIAKNSNGITNGRPVIVGIVATLNVAAERADVAVAADATVATGGVIDFFFQTVQCVLGYE